MGSQSLLFWSVLPIVVTIALYVALIGYLETTARAALDAWFAAHDWDPAGWAAAVARLLARMALVLVGALTFSFASAMVASPFNDFLAERSERFADPPLAPAGRAAWSAKIRLVLIDLLKSLAAAAASLVALFLIWIPMLNLAGFAVSFLAVAFQYLSYPQTRRGQGLREGLRFLGRHPFACLGFGGAVSFLFAVPLVSFVALPMAVVGGTLLYGRAPGGPGRFALK